MREISNLDLKIQLTNEYLRTGGIEKIFDVVLLQDLMNVKFDKNGKALAETITPRVNAFMLGILHSHSLPPISIENNMAEYKSFVQKSNFFEQHRIETKEQVDELIERFKDEKNTLFRGQREAKWRLYSTLQRFWLWDKMDEIGEKYLSFLERIVHDGRNEYEEAISTILKETNMDSLNDVSILGYLQHHNCPTPLIDWTYNFKTALFFGVDGLEIYESPREIDQYFSVYFIEEQHFDNGGMRTLLSDSIHSAGEQLKLGLIAQIAKDEEQRKEMEAHFKERSFFDKNRFKGSGVIKHMTQIKHMINIPLSFFSDRDSDSGIAFSLTNSENIKRQEGVFTWNADVSKPFEVIGNEQYNEAKGENDPDDYRFCECFNINKSLSAYILGKLEEQNITKETMYPDRDVDARKIYDNNKNTK